VIEFQHSHIDPKERTTREGFYQNMVWVVDGARLKRDYPRLQKAITSFHSIRTGIFRVEDPEECFPSAWLGSSVPVIFDFLGNELIGDPKDLRNNLFCLFPMRIGRDGIVVVLSRKAFIDAVISGKWTQWAINHMNNIRQVSQEWQEQMNRQQQMQDSINFERFTKAVRYRKGRRF
jgi:competence protein CoiA